MSRYTASHRKRLFPGLQKARLGFYTAVTIQDRSVGRLAVLSVPAAFPAPAVSMLRSPTVGYVWIVPTRLVSGSRLPCRRWFNGSAIPRRPRRRDEAACQENLAPSIAATLPHIGALSNAKAPCALFLRKQDFSVLPGRPAEQAPLGTKCLPGQMRRLPGRSRSKFGEKIAAVQGQLGIERVEGFGTSNNIGRWSSEEVSFHSRAAREFGLPGGARQVRACDRGWPVPTRFRLPAQDRRRHRR